MHVANAESQTASIPVRSQRKAMDWSLVLASQDIAATIMHSPESGWSLLVDSREYERAVRSIREYHLENRQWEWRRHLPWSTISFHWGAVPVCVLLALSYQISSENAFIRDAWVFKTALVKTGQWWRLFTAILLHADLAHLLANITTGVLLFGLAMARFGAGCGLLASFLAGAMGNLLGLTISGRPYTGLGASGMVMGALGLIVFHGVAQWRLNTGTARDLLRAGLAGVLLFVIFGVNPESDVIAHLGGFLGGALIGALLSFLPATVLEARRFVALNWLAFLVLLGGTGWLGLQHR